MPRQNINAKITSQKYKLTIEIMEFSANQKKATIYHNGIAKRTWIRK